LGNVINETQSSTNGFYKMKAKVQENKNCPLFISSKNIFFESKSTKRNQPSHELKTTLQTLKKVKHTSQINKFLTQQRRAIARSLPVYTKFSKINDLKPRVGNSY
jgi:hypothetical protein